MHKNMSVAQLNQPHLQGSFLASLHQQVNENSNQETAAMVDTFGAGGILNIDTVQGPRPDSMHSQNDRMIGHSQSQGKMLAGVSHKKTTQKAALLS